ncbi:hypothetical protein HU200_042484 [Digitaria exilis]|uniref:C2H2-type domain-containing protein n=1 Tax=Digitaria exilis TaxID=1010633 RepID=A0A835B4R9_9POAL|nr:hypothetical protein HU200_042484 [Digitaria exilis]
MPPSPSPPRPPGQPPPVYKHFCRVCNKGFTCGSALGGHMRAHGASDVVDGFGAGAGDDDSLGDEARCRGGSDDRWDAAVLGTSSSSATHAYALRANPNRLIRSCQVCKNCGKEFTSWELFLQHGKCSSEDDEGEEDVVVVDASGSPPSDDGEEDPAVAAAATAWSKGKRSRRVKLMYSTEERSPKVSSRQQDTTSGGEEEDLANCLVMLSSSSNNIVQPSVVETDQPKKACVVSPGKERDGAPPPAPLQLQPISIFMPASSSEPVVALPSATVVTATPQYISPTSRSLFECKACKKVFTSHQALGGHRASHKKVKGCFAAKFESNAATETAARPSPAGDPNNVTAGKGAAVDEVNAGLITDAKATSGADTTNAGTSEAAATSLSMALAPIRHDPPHAAPTVATPCKKNTKMHECSVCHRLFTSGQALGGHKRCHWLTSSTADPCTNTVANMTIPPLTEDLVGVVRHQLGLRPMTMDSPAEPALDLTIAANPAALATARTEMAGTSSFRLDALAAAPAHLQPLAVVAVPASTASHRKKTTTTSSHHATNTVAEEDEADSTTAKRAKLSDLKDVVSMDGEPTGPWLQVGIGSSSAGGDE